jgi:hypothetical protein
VTAGSAVFEFDPSAQTLTTTLPADLVPKYPLRVTLRRSAALVPAPRRPIDATVREPAWVLDLGSPIWADVAIDGDTVLAGTDEGRLHAVDAGTGRERWTFEAGGAIRARAAFIDGDIVVQADDGVLYRIDGKSGKAKWRVPIAKSRGRLPLGDAASRYENIASGAADDGRRLYVGTHEGRLLAIDARRGTTVWEFKAGDAIVATPVVAHGKVYCGSFDGSLYALDASTGALSWKHDTGGAVTSAVGVSGPNVLVGSRSYDLEALDARAGRRPGRGTSGARGWSRRRTSSSPSHISDRLTRPESRRLTAGGGGRSGAPTCRVVRGGSLRSPGPPSTKVWPACCTTSRCTAVRSLRWIAPPAGSPGGIPHERILQAVRSHAGGLPGQSPSGSASSSPGTDGVLYAFPLTVDS